MVEVQGPLRAFSGLYLGFRDLVRRGTAAHARLEAHVRLELRIMSVNRLNR